MSDTRSNAQQAVFDVQSQAAQNVHDTQRDAERAVQHAQSQAQSRVASVEGQASQLIRDITNEHRVELSRVQDIAHHAHHQAQVQLQEAGTRIHQVLATIESQHRALEKQRIEHSEMFAQAAALQNEVLMLKHSIYNYPITYSGPYNGAVDERELWNVIDSLRQEIPPPKAFQTPPPGVVPISTPPFETISASAGVPCLQAIERQAGWHRIHPRCRIQIRFISQLKIVTHTPPGGPGGSASSSTSSHGDGHRPSSTTSHWPPFMSRILLEEAIQESKVRSFQEIGSDGLRILGRKHRSERGLERAKISFDMGAYVAQVVSTCCKLTGTPISQLKRVSTPSFPETSMTGAELDHEGTLSGVASRVLMRGVWHCRLARLGISFFPESGREGFFQKKRCH